MWMHVIHPPKIFMSLVYFYSVWMFMNSSSVILFWLTMEINLFFFILLMTNSNSQTKSSLLYLFSIQALCSLSFILLMTLDMPLVNDYICYTTILILLSFKMSLFPFYSWGAKFSQSCSSYIFFLFVTIQKIPFFFLILMSSLNWISFSLINMYAGLFLAFLSKKLTLILFYSSIYMTVWMMIFLHSSVKVFSILLMFYLFFFLLVCLKKENSVDMDNLLVLASLMFFLSLPPFSMFFLKFFIFEIVIAMLGSMAAFLTFLGSFLILFPYSKFFFSFFLKNRTNNSVLMVSIKGIYMYFFFFMLNMIFFF